MRTATRHPTPTRHTARELDRQASAVIVGASLAGLMTGLTLSRAGVDVTMLERVSSFPRTGAALGVNEALIRRITREEYTTGSSAGRSRKPDSNSWSAIHARLQAAVNADPNIDLRHNARVVSVDQDADAAWATTADRHTFRSDVVIGADGYRSIVRGSVAPEHRDATFAGYLIWLGVLDESAVPAARHTHGGAFLGGGDECLFGYLLPGRDGGSMVPGSRQIGWAWYDGSRNDLLRDTGSVVGNVVQQSLVSADIPAATYRELAYEANARWPSPWSDAISACADRRAITGTPIAEYVPDRLVNGRLALVGDAAHVQTPMTGQGFSSALEDAEAWPSPSRPACADPL
jgi:2-polyprenyl-6-methoxyphenol hydroxylase-like FAD-dependent oxidoreductase